MESVVGEELGDTGSSVRRILFAGEHVGLKPLLH